MSQTPAPPPFPPPPPGAYGAPMPGGARQGNGMAITSLIMGILLCIPVITGLGGIIFGVVGLRKTRDPRIGGKGLAIAGLVLGVINILIWLLFGGAIWAAIAGTSQHREMARTFIKDLSEGNVPAAAAVCDPSTVSKSSLEKMSQNMKSWGTLKDTTTLGFNADTGGGSSQVIVTVAAVFSNAQKSFVIHFAKQGDKWKITKVEFP